jgi:hypothetical protein
MGLEWNFMGLEWDFMGLSWEFHGFLCFFLNFTINNRDKMTLLGIYDMTNKPGEDKPQS